MDASPIKTDTLDFFACYYADIRGGDFYDSLWVGGRLLFLLTDIAGDPERAVEVADWAQTVFRHNAEKLFLELDVNESDALASLAHAVNLALVEAAGGAHFSPTFLGCFNQALSILTYCNGGTLLPLFREGGQVRTLRSSAMPLGLFTHMTFEAEILAFQPGGALLVTTPGVDVLGVDPISNFLAASTGLSARELCGQILQQAHDLAEAPWWAPWKKQRGPQDLTALALIRST
jgi:serine phosphatase RsbU (regulator of sigma subunit)